ncbi:hypothetical protein EV424DRAFT_1444459 [Suillus variegatus]|nr:hypothetical protein EV424DRAFT_1444459 [Suillus variegatus]
MCVLSAVILASSLTQMQSRHCATHQVRLILISAVRSSTLGWKRQPPSTIQLPHTSTLRKGTSNTLKVVAYNSILGFIAFSSAGAIRQFCTFAVVVLVAHWFLAHTFFLAVLSIDIQRLELNQLLKQDPSIAPAASASARDAPLEKNASNWQRATLNAKESLKGRALTNISLLLLLAITATLYVMTRPATRESEAGFIIPSTVQQRTQAAHRRPDSQDPAWRKREHLQACNWSLVDPLV